MKQQFRSGLPNFEKFPVFFPVTRNFDSGDEFAVDCVHRQSPFVHSDLSLVFDILPKPSEAVWASLFALRLSSFSKAAVASCV